MPEYDGKAVRTLTACTDLIIKILSTHPGLTEIIAHILGPGSDIINMINEGLKL